VPSSRRELMSLLYGISLTVCVSSLINCERSPLRLSDDQLTIPSGFSKGIYCCVDFCEFSVGADIVVVAVFSREHSSNDSVS
jgi:hypothetical protein